MDQGVKPQKVPSRPVTRRPAVRPPPGAEPGPEYEEAFEEWERSGHALAWDQTSGDGILPDAPG